MTHAELRHAVVSALSSVAPEVDAASLQDDAPLREQVDLDSMDVLRFVTELHRTLGVDIPEADYARLASIGKAVEYLAARQT